VACRVYHPDLQGTRATGGSCGECRLRSRPCDLNGRPQTTLSKRKRASEATTEISQRKILRRGPGGAPTGMLNFCPAPSRTPKGMGTFICPIDGCLNPSSTRGDNFRRHIRQRHPESIHAQILEAVVARIKIQLPAPPLSVEYTADFEVAVSQNAPPGAFGRRSDSDWSALNMYIRTRIAHAKLIRGKYGVLAPESCANCRR